MEKCDNSQESNNPPSNSNCNVVGMGNNSMLFFANGTHTKRKIGLVIECHKRFKKDVGALRQNHPYVSTSTLTSKGKTCDLPASYLRIVLK